MANLKNDNYRFISIFDLKKEFGAKKTIPNGLVFPELQEAICFVLSDGTAEMSVFVRTDDPMTGAMLPAIGDAPGFYVEWEVSAEQLLDCISYGNVYDVVNGKIEVQDDDGKRFLLGIDEDSVRETVKAESRAMVQSYFCLFGAEVVEQAWSEFFTNSKTANFKSAIEASLVEQGFAVAA